MPLDQGAASARGSPAAAGASWQPSIRKVASFKNLDPIHPELSKP